MATLDVIYPIDVQEVDYQSPRHHHRLCFRVSSADGLPDFLIPCIASSGSLNNQQYYNDCQLAVFDMLSCHFPHIPPHSLLRYIDDYMSIIMEANVRHLCPNQRRQPATIRDSQLERAVRESFEDQRPRLRRASKASVESLLASTKTIEDGDHRECVICMEEIVARKSPALTMPCSHVFHQGCLLQWLQNSHVCPLCRFEMPCQT